MQRFLILSLFYIIAISPLIGQSDTLPQPEFDTTLTSGNYKIYTGQYTENELNESQLNSPIAIIMSAGFNQIFIKDNLISSHAYGGYGFNTSLFIENTNYERPRMSLGAELIYQQLRNDFTRGGILHGNLPISHLSYLEFNLPFEYNFRLAESPHYLGFRLNYSYMQIGLSYTNSSFSTPISDGYLSAGAAYFYRSKVFGIPIRANIILPIAALGFHSKQYTRFNTLSNYFRPTVQVHLFGKKAEKGHMRVSYQCRYFNTNRGLDTAFRHRHFQNLINVSYAWLEY